MFEYNLFMDESARVSQIYYQELVHSKFPPKKIVLFRNSDKNPITEIMTMEEHKDILGKTIPNINFDPLNLQPLENIKNDNTIVVTAKNINDEVVVQALREHLQGLTLIAATGILKEPILSLSHIKLINIHSGYLPNNRGLENFFYSLLYNETPGISIHEVNQGVDTGNIIYRTKIDFNLKNKNLENYQRDKLFVTLKYFIVPYFKTMVFKEYLKNLEENKTQSQKIIQDIEDGRTFYKIHPKIKDAFMDVILKV